MSHTTSISDIVFTDMAALQGAVMELQKSGVKCELIKDATPRAYYEGQAGLGQAPYVLRVNDARYDVGFYWNKEKNGYEARSDFFGGSVEKVLGNPGDNSQRAKLGKLYQMYGVHAATRKAVQQGYSVRRVAKADGTISLVMGVK